MVTAAGFTGFEIAWRKDVFGGAPQAGSAASFGTLGINFRARKRAGEGRPTGIPATSGREASGNGSTDRTTIDAGTLRDLLDSGRPVTVLDVRPEAQRAEWAIPGSLHVDAYEALNAGRPDALSGVDLPDDRPVITVCAAGRTSAIAAGRLRAGGAEALSLVGGMKAWSGAWNTAEVPVDGTAARVVQVRRTGKGCLSYVVGADGAAVVIDAALDPEVYLRISRENGWEVKAVADTHVHADHLSRSRELAGSSGAALYLPHQDRVSYAFEPLRDGDTLEVGAARLTAIRTPGHSPESACYLIDGKALLSGDTLFLAGVGRPDLGFAGTGHAGEVAREKAHELYDSLRRIFALPPETLVLPGHTGEPVAFDGEPLRATLGELLERAELLRAPEEEFVEAVLASIPPTPPNYERIVRSNEVGQLPDEELTELEAGANRCAAG